MRDIDQETQTLGLYSMFCRTCQERKTHEAKQYEDIRGIQVELRFYCTKCATIGLQMRGLKQ